MPELPEVETIRRSLVKRLPGEMIAGVAIRSLDVIGYPSAGEFQERLVGATARAIGRRGKYLLIHLESPATGDAGQILVVHLRMTGRLVLTDGERDEFPHTHVVLDLSSRQQLRFSDVRRFGRLYLYRPGQLPRQLLVEAGLAWAAPGDHHHQDIKPLGSPGLFQLGPEPLSDDFDAAYLARKFYGRRAPVKALLLDQSVVAGLGNIYVDEALFGAAIHPGTAAGSIDEATLANLVDNIKDVLVRAIAARGTTFSDYRDGSGEPGEFQNYLQVFARAGQPCTRCGTTIAKTRIAGRGTHFCPACQGRRSDTT